MKNNSKKKCIIIWFILIFIFIFIFIFLFIVFYKKLKIIEPFQWGQENIDRFVSFQSTINPQSHFNMQIVQNQASEEEALELFNTGNWPWSENTESLYKDAIAKEPIIRRTPVFSLQSAKTLYNENAIKKMLSWNTKEGQFLLSGGFNNYNNKIKCFSDANSRETSVLKKIRVNGYNLWNGYKNEKITNINNEDIPQEMPGFSFVSNPCNPCKALDDDYSCPFKLNVKGDDNISDIWKILWNLT